MNRFFQRNFAAIAVLLLAVALPSTVHAQEDPLRLVYINLAGSQGESSYDSVETLLEDSAQIDVVSEDIVLDAASEVGLNRADFGSDRRDQYEDRIAHVMWNTGVEGILVHNVDAGASNVTVGTIGPRGWELSEITHPLTGGDLEQDEALTILEDVFQSLVPDVRGFRRDVENGDLTDTDFELDDSSDGRPMDTLTESETDSERDTETETETEADSDTDTETAETDETERDGDATSGDGDLREQAAAEYRNQLDLLERSVETRAGVLTGYRTMEMGQPAGSFTLAHNTSLMGLGLRVDSVLLPLSDGEAGIGAAGVLGWSPFTTVFGENELGGTFIRLGAEGRYIYLMTPTTRFRSIGGFETVNLTIDPNEHYTGHGYMTGKLGAGFVHSLDDMAQLRLDALFLPIVTSSNSGGEAGPYGATSGWLGAGLDAGLDLEMFAPVLVSADYGFRYLDIDYPEPGSLDGPAESLDMFHHVMITAGYRL